LQAIVKWLRHSAVIAVAIAATAAEASAAPPPNDAPAAAGSFQAYSSANGRPRELQAVAELAEAAPDPGVPRCLGSASFSRTAWYRIPAAETVQEIAVDAIGRTLALVDLAAFVQIEGVDAPWTGVANACAGLGSGGSAAAEDATSGIALRVPARRALLLQVGRRGRAGAPDNERALISLDARPLPLTAAPAGDIADPATPLAPARRAVPVALAGATITEEDPAQPPCPALGTVWRRIVPGKDGSRLVQVRGRAASTLTVFAGARPTTGGVLDCVVRAGFGMLEMRVPVRRGRPLWIRVGTNARGANAAATMRVTDGADATVVDGGPGGFDPTAGGPAGGLPAACDRARPSRARIRGPRLEGTVRRANRRRFVRVVLGVRGSAICDAWVRLVGPHNEVYAEARARRLRGRRSLWLRRSRALVRGRYHVRVRAASELGGRVRVRTRLHGRLG
jgi:hypothetical protein